MSSCPGIGTNRTIAFSRTQSHHANAFLCGSWLLGLWAEMLFLEEATKLAGIAAWALFFVWGSQSVLLGHRRASPEPDARAATPHGFPP